MRAGCAPSSVELEVGDPSPGAQRPGQGHCASSQGCAVRKHELHPLRSSPEPVSLQSHNLQQHSQDRKNSLLSKHSFSTGPCRSSHAVSCKRLRLRQRREHLTAEVNVRLFSSKLVLRKHRAESRKSHCYLLVYAGLRATQFILMLTFSTTCVN